MWQNTQVSVLGALSFLTCQNWIFFSVDKGLPNETSSGGFLRKPRFIRKVLMGFSLLFARAYRISITCEAKVKEPEFIFERTVFRRHILWKFSFRELPLRKISSFGVSKKGAQTGIDFVAQEKKQLILHPCFIPGTAN